MIKKSIACLLILSTALLPLRIAQAGMIATAASADRAVVSQFISRSEVRQQLIALGADPASVEKRVASLSDAEAASLAEKIRTAPAGGNAGPGLVLFLLVVLVGFLFCAATVATKERPSLCFFPTRE
ncbi:MAG TPA: PA2779 family protein [Burkholderiales bacterium]